MRRTGGGNSSCSHCGMSLDSLHDTLVLSKFA